MIQLEEITSSEIRYERYILDNYLTEEIVRFEFP